MCKCTVEKLDSCCAYTTSSVVLLAETGFSRGVILWCNVKCDLPVRCSLSMGWFMIWSAVFLVAAKCLSAVAAKRFAARCKMLANHSVAVPMLYNELSVKLILWCVLQMGFWVSSKVKWHACACLYACTCVSACGGLCVVSCWTHCSLQTLSKSSISQQLINHAASLMAGF